MTRDAFDFDHIGPLPKVNVPLLRKTYEKVLEESKKPTIDDIYNQSTDSFAAEEKINALAETTGICRWNQVYYFATGPPCGTAGCFAGWAWMLIRGEPDEAASMQIDQSGKSVFVADWAKEELGLTTMEAQTLFAGSNEISDIREIVNDILSMRTRSKVYYD